ncbi:unnamed protein product [Paramecium sonneborni]|uniref:Uncharacterized protein n=1 Tax=Paramecium sonneborni TaxID=65129 RepID=A0A8S1PV02_9CILI|nr:unnamed protein product [Paramecium sonneborni]
MGNQCKGSKESNTMEYKSNLNLIEFIYELIQKLIESQEYTENVEELKKLLIFVESIDQIQQAQFLENDHFIALQKIKQRSKNGQKKIQEKIKELGLINLQESQLILNEYNLSNLQFQDLYNSINTLEYQMSPIIEHSIVLKNKQTYADNKEIVCEKQLYQMFTKICNKKFIIFQLIDFWITEIKSKNLKLIITIASLIINEIYSVIKQIKIPEKIFEILIIWMVQVIVFNISKPINELKKPEHLLDFIFYYKCPIEKMMILFAQQKLLKIQYVIRDTDDLADRIDETLKKYPRASLLKSETQCILDYVHENWFVSLYYTVRIWHVISNRF